MSIVSITIRCYLAAWLILLSVDLVGAGDLQFEKIGKAGVIDWVGQRLTATGVGVGGDSSTSPSKAEMAAQRTAVVVARRNLLEVVKGVAIDSRTTIEQSMLVDDSVVATINGFLRSSRIDRTLLREDGSVEATVSIALTGPLGETLNRLAAGPSSSERSWEARIFRLEKRVAALEEQLAGMHHAAAQNRAIMQILIEWSGARMPYQPNSALVVDAQLTQSSNVGELQRRLAIQENRYAVLAQQMKTISKRLSAVEADRQVSQQGGPQPKARRYPYTGIVIDARNLGFRPCLKPEIYGNGRQLYPGSFVPLETAVRSGYVRYYRNLTLAQQSKRVGSLPLTIRAVDTANGQRSLAIDPAAVDTLQEMAAVDDNILAACKVVIVF